MGQPSSPEASASVYITGYNLAEVEDAEKDLKRTRRGHTGACFFSQTMWPTHCLGSLAGIVVFSVFLLLLL